MTKFGRYYSADYGWREMEHGHVLTLTHLDNNVEQFECMCGERFVGISAVVKTLMLGHRLNEFPTLRRRLS